jgi:hypothetical protein
LAISALVAFGTGEFVFIIGNFPFLFPTNEPAALAGPKKKTNEHRRIR